MSQTTIPAILRQEILDSSPPWCAYCLTQTEITGVLLTVDHIIPEAFGGATVRPNLCLACWECNMSKGQRTVGFDAITNEHLPLFNPNIERWVAHFRWDEGATKLVGQTATGRATIHALRLNRPHLVQARRRWVIVGWHPPRQMV